MNRNREVVRAGAELPLTLGGLLRELSGHLGKLPHRAQHTEALCSGGPMEETRTNQEEARAGEWAGHHVGTDYGGSGWT